MPYQKEEKQEHNKQKKIYSQLFSSPFAEHLKPSSSPFFGHKKIVPTIAHSNMREDFKKLFLPLLIDIFELRQMLNNYKIRIEHPDLYPFEKNEKKPSEIMQQLRQIQLEIEESQRWCHGVIVQITKGIAEAQETLQKLEKEHSKKEALSTSSFKSFITKCKELLWKKK